MKLALKRWLGMAIWTALQLACYAQGQEVKREASASGIDPRSLLSLNSSAYLNNLLAETVIDNGQKSNIAFIKTHKTGGTLSTLLARYAQKHRLKIVYYNHVKNGHRVFLPVVDVAPKILEECGGRVDMIHYHICGPLAGLHNRNREDIESGYKAIMRDPENINYITIIREPREHLLSFYCYFIEPFSKISIGDFSKRTMDDPDHKHLKLLNNPLSREFSVVTHEDLDHFFHVALPKFRLVFLEEEFDEGLMVLRRLLGWHMINVTYTNKLNISEKSKSFWANDKGEEVHTRPRFVDLSVSAQMRIDELTALDRVLYEHGKTAWEKAREPFAQDIEKDLNEFHELQSALQEDLLSKPKGSATQMYNLGSVLGPPLPQDVDFVF
ncbi:unnamed protein product [Ascophyllum nodosum]